MDREHSYILNVIVFQCRLKIPIELFYNVTFVCLGWNIKYKNYYNNMNFNFFFTTYYILIYYIYKKK